VYAFIDGLLALVSAVIGGAPAPRWWLAVIGLLGIATGILTFAWPGITALVLLFFIAGWAIAVGIFQIIGAIRLRKEIENEWFLSCAVSFRCCSESVFSLRRARARSLWYG
jgi:uncharacterized membrane protein HdeD (DUF308 family)